MRITDFLELFYENVDEGEVVAAEFWDTAASIALRQVLVRALSNDSRVFSARSPGPIDVRGDWLDTHITPSGKTTTSWRISKYSEQVRLGQLDE